MSTDADVAIAAAEAAARLIRNRFGGDLVHHDKGGRDFATDVDLDAERAIRTVLQQARPTDGVVGEEFGGAGEAARTWLVDPLCGTLNFAAHTPLVAVNVALRAGDRVVAAALADPFAGETFWTDGAAAWLRFDGVDTPLVPTGRSALVDLNVDAAPDRQPVAPVRLLAAPAFSRRFGARVLSTSLGLGWLAAGRRAAYVTAGAVRDSVHMTAGLTVCQAAGCVVTALDGQPLYASDGLLAAADAETHAALLELLAAL